MEPPEAYRTVLLLRGIQEHPKEETGRMLRISESAVNTRWHRARQALRDLLGLHPSRGAR